MTDEKVGYGNPPLHTRFKPGNRANPLGRGAKTQSNHSDILKRHLNTTETIFVGRKKTKITRLEAMVKRIGDDAVRGSIESASDLLGLRKCSVAMEDFQQITLRFGEVESRL